MGKYGELSTNLELVNSYTKIGHDYGLFSKRVSVPQPGGAPKEYLVFSLTPIKNSVNPVEIINRNHRNPNLFYPENYAVELNVSNPLLVWQEISIYLAYAEFMSEVYERFDAPLPKAIRADELSALANFYCNAYDERFDEETRSDYLAGLHKFFAGEMPKSKLKQEWQEFYRSELFDENKSFLHNVFTFLKRNEPETSLDALIESGGAFKKVRMPEHRYKEFREIIKERYPGVKYHVGEKQVVDNGLIVDPATGERAVTPYGKTVTEEEYDRIMEERFATEGYACIDGLTPSYFEGRDIFYKASDENIIASVDREVCLRWAKCCDLETLNRNGAVNSVDIPIGYIMNFYDAMRSRGILFTLDYDVNHSPSFDSVRFVYNTSQEDVVQSILVGLVVAQVNLAHVSLNNQDVVFEVDIAKIDTLIRRARTAALKGGNVERPAIQGDRTKVDESVEFNN